MKVCVYAICKNEFNLIDRWLDSMQEADYIVVLDTGSTDGSYEKLKNDSRVTKVEQQIIHPWRFDVARNESMKLVPNDTDIYVCTDFDEFFEAGWCQILKDNWKENDDRCHYTYAWSHNELGEPQDVFMYDKIHTNQYYWKFPVHEVLYPINEDKIENVLNAEDHIYLHHVQDLSKERSYYFELLQLSVKENPDNSHCRMLLAREYLLKKDFDNALLEYEKCLTYEDIYTDNFKLVLLETYGRLLDIYYWQKNNLDKAIHYFFEFLKIDKTYREPYFCMADICINLGLYELAISIINAGLNAGVRHYSWVERKDFWIAKAEELLFYCYYELKNYSLAKDYGKIAVEHNPNNTKLLNFYIKNLEQLIT